MPSLQIAQSETHEKPLFLISGSLPSITNDYINTISRDYKLILLNNTNSYTSEKDILQVYSTATETITKLKEKIDYAVFFVTTLEDKKIVEKMASKLEKDSTRTLILFSVLEYDSYSDILLRLKSIPSVMFGLLGEIFGTNIEPSFSRVSNTIHRALVEKSIVFVGNELIPIYPISAQDVINGITYLLYSRQKVHRIFFFYYEHPQTVISTIHILKRIEPDLQILPNSKHEDSSIVLTHGEIEKKIASQSLLKTMYLDDVLSGFEKSVRETKYFQHSDSKNNQLKIKKKSRRKQKITLPSTFILMITCAVLIFLISNVVLTLSGVLFAKRAITSITAGNFQNAQVELSYANASFNLSEPVISSGFKVLQLFPIPSVKASYETFLSGIRITEMASEQLSKIKSLEKGMARDDLLEILATISYLYFMTQSSPDYEKLPHVDFLTKSSTSNILTTFPILPNLMGYEIEKRYLLLFQNNGELRPTGGFIGSVGELIVKNGRVEQLNIQDVYDIDGQITSHTEPPYIVRKYLQPHLYLRDSNFSLDFQEAATTAAALYVEGGGKTVDGVIALDYTVLQKIMEVSGPIYLPSHNHTIDSKSGFEFIQSTIDDTFIPGASQKKSILSEVFNQLLIKLEDPKIIFGIAKILPELIEEKHILFAMKDVAVQDIFTKQYFAGSLHKIEQSNPQNYYNYLSINEANIGVNKANVSVTRKVSLLQKISPNSIISSATVTLDNTNGKEGYKTYIRFVTPKDTEFEELLINGKVVQTTPAITNPQLYESPSFTQPSEVEVTEEVYQDKKVYGFVYTVPQGTSDYLTLQYSQEYTHSSAGYSYNLFYQPQPGTAPTPFTLSLEFPDSFIAKDISSGSVAQKTFSNSYVMKKDTAIQIEFKANN
jgi:hypothetical protein